MIKNLKQKLQRSVKRLGAFVEKHPVIFGLLVVAAAAAIFMLRNLAIFREPNFYAEDATVLFQNIYERNPLRVLLMPFNGYLISGQYMLAYIAAGINLVFGNDLDTLPIVTAVVSCLFFGLIASLPYLLFKKQLGKCLALITVLLTALVPMRSYDYAIIGTISNLKFAFLYVALMLVIYRVLNRDKLTRKQFLAVDIALLLCAATNVTVAFLLPIILVPDLLPWLRSVRKRKLPKLSLMQISALALIASCLLYVAAALLRGIPKIPGYLDGPFDKHAILPIADRSLGYALSYPFTEAFNNVFVAAGLLVMAVIGLILLWRRNDTSYVVLAAAWAVFLGTVVFVVNRPGIGDLYLTYNHKGGPDQFFYAQNMVFIFALAWIVKDWIRRLSLNGRVLGAAALVLYLLVSVPLGTSFGGSAAVYGPMDDIDENLTKACRQYGSQPVVIIQIYPSSYWQWQVDRDLACD